MQQAAANAYAKVAQQTVEPRELEASLLVKAALRLQSLIDAQSKDRAAWHEAIVYNRQLWVVLSSAVTRPDSPLPSDIQQNIANLALFVFRQGLRAEARRDFDMLKGLIGINRDIAAGLRGM